MKLAATTAPVAALVAGPALAAGPATGFEPPRDCDAGTTIFRDGPVRLLLAISAGTVTWRTRSGARSAAPAA